MLTETLFLHERPNYLVEYNLSVGTYAWQAPDAWNLGSGTQFTIDCWMWAGGAGGSSGNNAFANFDKYGGGGGGGGGFVRSQIRAVVGQTYTLSVGAGGIGNPKWIGTFYPGGGGTEAPAPIRGTPGGNTGISDSLGAIVTATGGQGGTGRPIGPYANGGAGGSGVISQPTKTITYSIVGGGRGGSSYVNFSGNPRTPPQSVAPFGDQPGGAGGIYKYDWWKSSGGGGGSAHAKGGDVGNISYIGSSGTSPEANGSGGGAGYFKGEDGGPSAWPYPSSAAYFWLTKGGNGGNGYLTFSFMVQDGGSAGSAPQ